MRIKLKDAVQALGQYNTWTWRSAADVVSSVSTWPHEPTSAERIALTRHALLLTESAREEAKKKERKKNARAKSA